MIEILEYVGLILLSFFVVPPIALALGFFMACTIAFWLNVYDWLAKRL